MMTSSARPQAWTITSPSRSIESACNRVSIGICHEAVDRHTPSGIDRYKTVASHPIELEYGRHFRLWERPVEIVSLDRVTPLAPQELQLIRGFHPFGDHSEL